MEKLFLQFIFFNHLVENTDDVMIECWADYPIDREHRDEIYQRLRDELLLATNRYPCRIKLYCWLNGTAIHDI